MARLIVRVMSEHRPRPGHGPGPGPKAVPCLLCILLLVWCSVVVGFSIDDPVLPTHFYESWVSPYAHRGNSQDIRRIPKHVWFNLGSYATAPASTSELPKHLTHIHEMALRETNWTVHLISDSDQNDFMRSHFSNTSTLWAYNQINQKLGVSRSDIWRYSQLLLFGGAYFDEDSTVDGSLDALVRPDDEIVLTTEPNIYKDECYKESYHLSDASMSLRFSNARVNSVMEHRSLANWGFMVAPKNPILTRVLENVVELVKKEYLGQTALKLPHHAFRWKTIMCVTGPIALTASVKEAMLEQPNITTHARLERRDFKDWGGRFKIWGVDDPLKPHYMLRMQKESLSLLQSYRPTPLRELELLSIEVFAEPGKNHISQCQTPSMEPTRVPYSDSQLYNSSTSLHSQLNSTTQQLPTITTSLSPFLSPTPTPSLSSFSPIYFVIVDGAVRHFLDEEHARRFGYVERTAVSLDPLVYKSLPIGECMPLKFSADGTCRVSSFVMTRLEGRLVCSMNHRHKRTYYVISNGTTQAFVTWDHLTSALASTPIAVSNRSIDEALLLDEDFVEKSIPIGGFFGLQYLTDDCLVTAPSTVKGIKSRIDRGYYALRNRTFGYCHFRDWDSFTSSRFSSLLKNAIKVREERIANTKNLGNCD